MIARILTSIVGLSAVGLSASAQDAVAPAATSAASSAEIRQATFAQTRDGSLAFLPAQPETTSNSAVVSAAPNESMSAALPGNAQAVPAFVPTPPTEWMDFGTKPKDLITRQPSSVMSRYVVKAVRVPLFRLRDVYTKSGLQNIAFRTHPGLHAGNFFNSNSSEAYEMYLDDERFGNIQDLQDTAFAMVAGGDTAEANAILKATGDAYYFQNDDPTDPIANLADAPRPRTGQPLILDLENLRIPWLTVRF